MFGLLASLCVVDPAVAADLSEEDEAAEQSSPTIYLDLRTTYSGVPPGILTLGFRGFAQLSTLASTSREGLALDIPLTFDLTETFSLYGGTSTFTSRTDFSSWTPLMFDSWHFGFQADVYQQQGGWFPTVTVQSTLYRSIPQSALQSSSITSIIELGYALDSDETRGLLAGVQHTSVIVDSPLVKVNPAIIGYVGAYYYWSDVWKVTGRFGVQTFGGAQLPAALTSPSFAGPVIRLDLDRVDDNDNRLFGLTTEIAWTPKPAFQLVFRSPLYLVRN